MLKRFIQLMSIVLSAFFLLPLSACSNTTNNNQEAPSSEPQVLRVAMSGDVQSYQYQSEGDDASQEVGLIVGMAPYCWMQEDDSNGAVKIENSDNYMNGYDVKIAKKVAEKLNKELAIVDVPWEDLTDKVNNGEVDLIISGMSPTKERRENLDFSDYYYTSGFAFVVDKKGPLKDATKLTDFKGALLASMSNTVPYTLLDAIENVNKVPLDNFMMCEATLFTGDIDGFLTETPMAKLACSKITSFKIIDVTNQFNLSKDEYSVAVGMKKGSDLMSKVNEAISEISAEERETLMNEAIEAA